MKQGREDLTVNVELLKLARGADQPWSMREFFQEPRALWRLGISIHISPHENRGSEPR
jgi:hypothetical protein